jgi:hypothetical protein
MFGLSKKLAVLAQQFDDHVRDCGKRYTSLEKAIEEASNQTKRGLSWIFKLMWSIAGTTIAALFFALWELVIRPALTRQP